MQHSDECSRKFGIPQLSREEMQLEITQRLRCARLWCQRHLQLLRHPDVSRHDKFQLYKFFIRPILTYGCELWRLDARSSRRLLRFESATLLEIYKSKYPHRDPKRLRPDIRMIYCRYRDTDVIDHVRNERLNWKELLRSEEIALRGTDTRCNHIKWWDQPDLARHINSRAMRPRTSSRRY